MARGIGLHPAPAPNVAEVACWRLVPARRMTWQSGVLRFDPDLGGWGWEDGVEPSELKKGVPRAYWTPPLVDAHTHLGDAFLRPERENLPRSIPALVAPPDGVKHQRLRTTPEANVQDAMAKRMHHMGKNGTALALDFREGGAAGVRLLHDASAGSTLQVAALARPAAPAEDASRWIEEAQELVSGPIAGLGLSGVRDLPAQLLAAAGEACHRAGKPLALHLAEARPEAAEEALRHGARILVHLVHTSGKDWDALADARVLAVTCPSSNRFFGLTPPLAELYRMHREQGLAVAVGTDNAMLGDGDLCDEARLIASAQPRGDLDWLLAALTWTPWRHLDLEPPAAPGLLWGVRPDCPATHPEDTPLGRTRPLWEHPVYEAPAVTLS